MNQKNLLKLLVIFSVIVSLFAVYVSAVSQSTARPAKSHDIEVNIINQEPDPAEPGRYVDVRFKFDNNGSGEARNVKVEILPKYPFSLDPGQEAVRNIGTIQSRQRGDVGVIVKYRLRIDKDAVEGENELKIRFKIDTDAWIELEEFMVDIQTHDAILAIDSVSLDPKALEPGSSGIIKIVLSNKADSVLKNIKLNLGLGDLPLVPVDSTNEKSVYKIDSRQDYEFEFNILATPDAESGVYKVPISLHYLDELGKGYSINATIGLTIGAVPDLSITLDDSEIFESGKAGEIVIKVVNKGVTDVKFMNIQLAESDDYRILSTDEVYLGNIDSDDFETAEYNLFIENRISSPNCFSESVFFFKITAHNHFEFIAVF